jgi:hypothetical protein
MVLHNGCSVRDRGGIYGNGWISFIFNIGGVMKNLAETIIEFEKFTAKEDQRWLQIHKEILSIDQMLKNCPSLWGHSMYFSDIESTLSVIEGHIFMECSGESKPLWAHKHKLRIKGYLHLSDFLDYLMRDEP